MYRFLIDEDDEKRIKILKSNTAYYEMFKSILQFSCAILVVDRQPECVGISDWRPRILFSSVNNWRLGEYARTGMTGEKFFYSNNGVWEEI